VTQVVDETIAIAPHILKRRRGDFRSAPATTDPAEEKKGTIGFPDDPFRRWRATIP
jgi:hypothetical protein